MTGALKSTLAVLAAIAVMHAAPAAAKPLVCPARWGEPSQSLVRTPDAARSIFLAVELDFFPRADRETYPEVEATDDGERWIVYRFRPPVTLSSGDVEITRGGGQLALAIAKCDGAISNVHFSR